MSFWDRLTGGKPKPSSANLDYLNEALALERQGDYDAALTSYRLALRQTPNNHKVLQNMAIAFSRTGRETEAIRCYRRALEIQPKLSGAHYGLAFLLLRRGETGNAAFHLESFLMDPPAPSAEADRWIRHARETLERIRTADDESPAGTELQNEEFPEVSE